MQNRLTHTPTPSTPTPSTDKVLLSVGNWYYTRYYTLPFLPSANTCGNRTTVPTVVL